MTNKVISVLSEEERNDLSEQISFANDYYPFSIVAPLNNYLECLEAEDWNGAYRCMLDFFEIFIQYNSGLLISLLIHSDADFDEALKDVLEKIVEKPLSLGDWVMSIFIVLLKKARVLLPENRYVTCLNDLLFADEQGNVLQGWNKKGNEYRSIANLRNDWGHDTFRSRDIIHRELAVMEPRAWQLLKMIEPIADYYFFVPEQAIDTVGETRNYMIIPDPKRGVVNFKVSTDLLLEENTYYMTSQALRQRGFIQGSSIVKLSPFIIYHGYSDYKEEEQFQYVFQTLNDRNLKKMVFVSAHKNARRIETELFKDGFWRILERAFGKLINQIGSKLSFSQEKSLSDYEERFERDTSSFINDQISSDKYAPELFLEREYLATSFRDFLAAEASAFVMLGDAGAGKTNQICHWASTKMPGIIQLAYYSKIFSKITLEEKLKLTFGEKKIPALKILTALDEALIQADMTVCIYFDAINECITYSGGTPGQGPIDLLLEIDRLFIQPRFERLKIIVSCRSYTWEELLSQDGLALAQYYTAGASKEYTTLKTFSTSEFEEVYPKYAGKYDLKTSLARLEEDSYHFVRQRLSDPLILKTAAQNFQGRQFPSDIRQFNSTKLFAQRFDALGKKDKGIRQVLILQEFTALLWSKFTDSISLTDIHYAFEDEEDPLHVFATRVLKKETMRFKDEFIGLLDEGILRVENGVRKEIRFVYERFNEFMFAHHFLNQSHNAASGNIPVAAALYEDVLSKAGHSTVIIAALRNALIIDFFEKKSDPVTLIELSLSTMYESQPLIEETLSVLMDESYDDVLAILKYMLDYKKDESRELLAQREKLDIIVSSEKYRSKMSADTMLKKGDEKQRLNDELVNVLKVRNIAISIVYKIFKSHRAEELLMNEQTDPTQLLWIAMADPLSEVRDTASTYIYYISRYKSVWGTRIIDSLLDKISKTSVTALLRSSSRKLLQQSYIEPAARVGLFLVIDGLIERKDYETALNMQQVWQKIVRKFTFNHTLIKLVMPFFKILFARQTVVQKDYVNNAIEYRHFWDKIPLHAGKGEWSRSVYKMLVPYLDPATEDFSQHTDVVIKGYMTGDSYSFFLLERILIVQGLANWENVEKIIHHLCNLPDKHPYRDYIEISIIYSLYQISLKSLVLLPATELIFNRMVEKWSIQQKGFYYAHYNDMANKGRPYKQFILNWYATVYCHHYGDGQAKEGDEMGAPMIRRLIELAYKNKDKALLYNCIENISMIVASSGHYKIALQLFECVIGLFKNESDIRAFDKIVLADGLYDKGLRSFICDMLGTIKSYYPKEVDHFVVNKLKSAQFPNMEAFREEVFNHSLSHEAIGDLLTHKFGNFVAWGIVNDHHVRQFFMQVCYFGADAKDFVGYFDNSIRHIFQEVFGVKNLSPA